MSKNRYHSEFTENELQEAKTYMLQEIKQSPKRYQEQLFKLFWHYWVKFLNGDFAVDGATFIDEEKDSFFNIWWFIHDARNADGYVGTSIDNEMIDIMVLTDTPAKHFKQAIPFLKFTWINWLRHLFKGSLKRSKPNNLVIILE